MRSFRNNARRISPGVTLLKIVLVSLLIAGLWASSAYAATDGTAVSDAPDEAVNAAIVTEAGDAGDEAAVEAAAGEEDATPAVETPAPAESGQDVQPAQADEAAGNAAATTACENCVDDDADDEVVMTGSAVSADSGEDAAAANYDGDGEQNNVDEVCEDLKEQLELICGYGEFGVYWESKADYEAGLLSMDFRLRNTGATDLYNVTVNSATATNGVTVATSLPLDLGDLAAGDWVYFTLKWLVPEGVGSFVTDISICADCTKEEELCTDCDGDEKEEEEDEEENPLVDPGGEEPVAQGTAATRSVDQVYGSSLPNTGFNIWTPILFGFGIAGMALLVPVLKPARRRRK